MTVFSAVTYSTAFTLAHYAVMSSPSTIISNEALRFLVGWVFVLLCQLSAHLLGEYYDYDADKLTMHTSPFTGGSRVLVRHPQMRIGCGLLGWACSGLALAVLFFALPPSTRNLAFSLLFLATQYSGAPLRLNHRCLGEACAALVMNVLLPLFAAQLALPANVSVLTHRVPNLALLIVPSALLKFALFLVLNLADKRPDWLAGKRTLPVLLDAPRTAKLHAFAVFATYASAVLLCALGPWTVSSVVMTVLILASAPRAVGTARKLLACGSAPLTPLVLASLQQAPLPLLAIFFSCMAFELIRDPLHATTLSFHLRLAVIYPFLYMLLFQRRPGPPPQQPSAQAPAAQSSVIVVGGGIAGLVMAVALQRLGIRYVLIEKRARGEQDDGADLGLWPSGWQILQALGVPAAFLADRTYAVKRVHMRTTKGEVLKVVNMEEVVKGTGQHFRLVSRRTLMSALQALLPSDAQVHYDASVTDIKESGAGVAVSVVISGVARTFNASVVIGADGIKSACRQLLVSDGNNAARHSGEVCHRGVCDLGASPALRELFMQQQAQNADTMTLLYGVGTRASWGLLDSSAQEGFWWIKLKEDAAGRTLAPEKWPEPLPQLYAATPGARKYAHAVMDRVPAHRWCSARCALVGDAAHPTTPNMAQGANMAIEDSFVLATLLARCGLGSAEGHQEAFYQYFRLRHPHTTRVSNESYQQSKLGQWTHPWLVALRETLLRRVPASVLQGKLRKVNLWPIEPWLSEWRTLVSLASPPEARM